MDTKINQLEDRGPPSLFVNKNKKISGGHAFCATGIWLVIIDRENIRKFAWSKFLNYLRRPKCYDCSYDSDYSLRFISTVEFISTVAFIITYLGCCISLSPWGWFMPWTLGVAVWVFGVAIVMGWIRSEELGKICWFKTMLVWLRQRQ